MVNTYIILQQIYSQDTECQLTANPGRNRSSSPGRRDKTVCWFWFQKL